MTEERVVGLPSLPELDKSIASKLKVLVKMGAFCPVDLMRGPAAAPHTELFLTPEPGEAEVSDGKVISEVVSKETDV
jgi:hypothetical protein